MGLDVTAYKGIKKLGEPVFDAQGDEIGIKSGKTMLADGREVETFIDISDIDFIKTYNNPNFPFHCGDLDDSVVYSYDDAISPFSCGYIQFNNFKNELAKIAGYPAHLGSDFGYNPYLTTVIHEREIEGKKGGILSEFLYFSDTDGTICNKFCRKILSDLKTIEPNKSQMDSAYQELFNQLLEIFEFVGDDGFVIFK